MYFYHEGYHTAYYADAAPDNWGSRDRRGDDLTYEPVGIPAIANWLVIVTVALCLIVTAINGLS